MNLRQEPKPQLTSYLYFIYYGFFLPDNTTGEGFHCVSFPSMIKTFTHLTHAAEIIQNALEKEHKTKVTRVIIRNFILIDILGDKNGIKRREEEASLKDDPAVLEEAQG